ncbi:hypothetical protein F7725_001482 [Dissostichus mawsoni]|uniref:Uncharacterized protein n=1 Tax=Dissostichus mawsoni TaxID=36200 RepID=A0A7J5Y0P1_DISMA|nr:hypothetical protein F7725_001482 [Dissostichus mawsoni]
MTKTWINPTNSLLQTSARQKYHMYIDDQRRLKQDEKKTQKRKGLMEEITDKSQKEENGGRHKGLLIMTQKKLSHKAN